MRFATATGLRRGSAFAALAAACLLSGSAGAAPMEPDGARLARIATDLERLESVRAVKRLQVSYALYSQFGLWSEMADLFSANARLDYGDAHVAGRDAIARWMKSQFGGGREGLAPGGVHTQFAMIPVVNLSADGNSAKGRWHELSLLGRYGSDARWAGGIQENEYVRERGVWKIARLQHNAIYAGPYETGFLSIKPQMDVIPYHYTADEAGAPIGPPSVVGPMAGPPIDAAAIDARLARMHDEDLIRNLQNAYGYYVDRKMWTDVTDLFAADGTFEIAGIGVWKGEQGIRRLLGREGPEDLRHGEANDHLQLDTLITVSPDGREAWARGIDFGMLGHNNEYAVWTEGVFENHYVKSGGRWRMQNVRLFPKLRSDYYQGWAKSQMAEPKPTSGYLPDAPSSVAELPPAADWVPAFRVVNPVTGRAVRYPRGVRVVDTGGMLGAAGTPTGDGVTDVAALERRLAVELAYDSVENTSSAFGGYLDDYDWDNTSAVFALQGRREKYQIGFYETRERVRLADLNMYGRRPAKRTSVTYHIRTQPVIDVAPDAKSAKLRTRLFLYSASTDRPGSFGGGMYPNDLLIPENGSWKFLHQAINEPYVSSSGYANGWAKVPEPDPKLRLAVRPPSSMMDRLRASFPPDVATGDLGVRGWGFTPGPEFLQFPQIKPMWFHYLNPVSGRVPPHYCPDESTCYQRKPLFKVNP